jgi:predicted nucleic acid-binding protein
LIVIDASAALEVLLRTPAGLRIESRIVEADELYAPHLIDVEILHTLRRLVLRGLSEPTGKAAVEAWRTFVVQRMRHALLARRIWSLRNNHTCYDAAYIALAEAMGAPLVTHDRKFISPAHVATVEVY